jgi:hypothetical protein
LKISKRLLLIIGIGVFAILLFTLYRGYSQAADEQSQLSNQLTLAKSRLAGLNLEQLSSQQAEREEQLSQATSELEAVKVMLSQPVGSVNVTSVLFDLAKACDVEVIEVTSPGPTTENLEGVTCSVIPLTARVEGEVSNLVSFVTRLNSHFTTGVVKSVTINVLESTSSDNASANIQLAVYSYQGG